MPEEQEKAADAEVVVPGKASKTTLLMVLNLLLVAGVFGYLFFFSRSSESAAPEKEAPSEVRGDPGPLVKLDNFIVNLADPEANRYLKVGLSLEVADQEAESSLRSREPIIRDAVISLASGLTYKQVRTHQGKQALRENILAKLDEILGEKVVRGVYFTEFVVQ